MEELGFRVTYLPVDSQGNVDPDDLKKAITEDTFLITIIHANNEVGTIQPLQEIGKIAGEKGIAFHTDAVQAAGKIDTNVEELECDLLSLSAHKLYGPKGVGALYVRKDSILSPILHGGPHEKRFRAGTENVPGIVGMGKACEVASNGMTVEGKRLEELRDRLKVGFEKVNVELTINTPLDNSLPGTLNFCIHDSRNAKVGTPDSRESQNSVVNGEALLQALDLEGICISTGSACESGSTEPSHVLLAMGISEEEAKGAVRMSLGRWTTQEEIDRVIEVTPEVTKRIIDQQF
jgi:cysteine desulfurase